MTVFLVEFAIVLVGLIFTVILFYHFPILPDADDQSNELTGRLPSVSVIIPARNEEKNLMLILQDLKNQTLPADEIICVDDDSEDATSNIALSCGATLLSLKSKAEGWTGKSWACQKGADIAKSELILFLDADVRFGKDALLRLMQVYQKYGTAISVQPYHKTIKPYEQLSMLFNLIQIAANGTTLPKPLNLGLYGPVILINQTNYKKAGGHKSVRASVIEDVALGMQLKQCLVPYKLFIGDEDVSFRMYANGLKCLYQGWVKNMASGASKTPLYLFFMVFFWVASLASVPLQLIKTLTWGNVPWTIVYSALYIIWTVILVVLTNKIGRFQIWTYIFYPVLVFFLIGVFLISMVKKFLGLKVIWKGRAVASGKKQ